MGVSIRKFKEEDVDQVYDLIHKTLDTATIKLIYEKDIRDFWNGYYSKRYLLGSSKLKNYYVALINGKIVGIGSVSEMENKGYISSLYIDPDFQRNGIGSQLMCALEQDEICRRTGTAFLHSILSATKFYQKIGYRFNDDFPEVIQDCGLDVVYMEKKV